MKGLCSMKHPKLVLSKTNPRGGGVGNLHNLEIKNKMEVLERLSSFLRGKGNMILGFLFDWF